MASVESENLMALAEAAHSAGNLQEAEQNSRKALLNDDKCLPALVLLGIIASKTGRVAQGIQSLRSALAINSECFEAHYWLGILYRMSGDIVAAVAEAERAVELHPHDASAQASLGSCYSIVQKKDRAIAQFSLAIELDPTSAVFRHNLGLELQRVGRDNEAIHCYRAAIELEPSVPNSYVTLGKLLKDLKQNVEAEHCFAEAFKNTLPTAAGYFNLGRSLIDEGIVDEAETCFRKTLELDPESASAFAMLGSTLLQLGRFEEAFENLQIAIKLQPSRVRPYIDIIYSRKATEETRPMLDQMAAMLRDRAVVPEDRRNLHYALGKAYNDLGEYRKAIQHFDEANGMMLMQLAGRPFDRDGHSANFDRMIRTFHKESFASNRAIGNPSDKPIFIVGMIRSGTTLVEQIISSHPTVTAGGELTYLLKKFQSAVTPPKGSPHAAESKLLATGFLELLQSIGGDQNRVTDKMPHNFLLLGLIHTIFPNAKIIHCRRHPVDTCISIYTTPFPEPLNFAHSQEGIVFFYKEYQRIMEHWRQVIPSDRLLEVDYEELVMNRDAVSRQMIEFCGLDWDDACLHHERNDGAIRTPSWWQARQPVYRTSIGRWRHYEPWLGPFEELL